MGVSCRALSPTTYNEACEGGAESALPNPNERSRPKIGRDNMVTPMYVKFDVNQANDQNDIRIKLDINSTPSDS